MCFDIVPQDESLWKAARYVYKIVKPLYQFEQINCFEGPYQRVWDGNTKVSNGYTVRGYMQDYTYEIKESWGTSAIDMNGVRRPREGFYVCLTVPDVLNWYHSECALLLPTAYIAVIEVQPENLIYCGLGYHHYGRYKAATYRKIKPIRFLPLEVVMELMSDWKNPPTLLPHTREHGAG